LGEVFLILRISIGGFLLGQETQDALNALKEDRLLFRCSFEVEGGGIDTAVANLAERTTPNLLIVETNVARDQVFDQLELLANVCDPQTRLILISPHNDIDLFQELLNSGVSDYLVSPVSSERIRDSISKVYRGSEAQSDGRVIAFMGMAGGVGSSVLAHNTALELATIYDSKSLVVDCDINFGTAALNFNQQPRQTIADALTQFDRVERDLLDQFLTSYEDTVSILASPASLTSGAQFTPEKFDGLLNSIRPMADFIILDLPHLWATWVNDALAAADELIFVAHPDLTGLRNTKTMIEYIGPKRGVDAPTRLVLNQMGASKKGELTQKDFEDAIAMTPAVTVPYDSATFGKALNSGEMLPVVSAKSKAVLAIHELAEMVSDKQVVDEKKKSSMFSLFKK
jgi:pilus assembly protein CpaE